MTFADCKNARSCGKDLCLPEFCHQFDPKQKAVDVYATTASLYMSRLLDKISEYACRNGEYPQFILATARAYWFIENYSHNLCLKDTGRGMIAYFRGIEVRIVSGDGFDVFLCGEPISLRE